MPEQIEKTRVAVLIDGDNASPALLPQILLEMTKYGRTTIKRVYGDWTTPQMGSWKKQLLSNATQPVQQFRNTLSKNATDSAMIIDATDLLNKRAVDVFCIVSSDSDFTRLATRIREDGSFVVGIGEAKTPDAFVKACDVFIRTETLSRTSPKAASEGAETGPAGAKPPTAPSSPAADVRGTRDRNGLVRLFQQAFASLATADGEGWVNLGPFGNKLRSIDSAFDVRAYDRQKLSDLLADFPEIIEQHRDTERIPPVVYVRLREEK